MERREILRVLAVATTASQFTGFDRWVFAHDHDHGQKEKPKASGPYKPQFFTPEEYETVKRLAELIIPSDGTPGAREAGVSEFIDFMVASDRDVQPRFRKGLAWLDAHARRDLGGPFAAAPEERQTELLGHLAYKDRHRPGEEEGRAFFGLVRDFTVMGFYTSRVGMEQLDYPGLQEYYPDLPGCPHTDNREHKNLPPARG
jgi:hypothetical protein